MSTQIFPSAIPARFSSCFTHIWFWVLQEVIAEVWKSWEILIFRSRVQWRQILQPAPTAAKRWCDSVTMVRGWWLVGRRELWECGRWACVLPCGVCVSVSLWVCLCGWVGRGIPPPPPIALVKLGKEMFEIPSPHHFATEWFKISYTKV